MMRTRDYDDRRDDYRDETDREKRDWREVDRNKDRSPHYADKPKGKTNKRAAYQEQRAASLAKQALNEFFSGKKSKTQESDWKKVKEGSQKNFSKRASDYVGKHGLPREWDDLLLLLDHTDPEFVTEVIEKLSALSKTEATSRLEVLDGKLRVLKMMREEPPLLAKIERLQNAIKEKI